MTREVPVVHKERGRNHRGDNYTLDQVSEILQLAFGSLLLPIGPSPKQLSLVAQCQACFKESSLILEIDPPV